MKYLYQPTRLNIEQRKMLNEKVLYLIDSGTADASGITGEDIFNAYTGVGGLHGLKRDDFTDYHALMDYSRMLGMVCDEWELEGFHRATYEYYAEKLQAIARKYQAGIGYDYDAAVEKCRKKREKKQRDDDVGGEAMELAYRKSLRAAEVKPSGKNEPADSPWTDE